MLLGVAGPPLFGTGPDPAPIRDFAQAVEGMGYNHYGFAERIVQNDVSKIPEMAGRGGNHRGLFNEGFNLMSFFAGVTTRIELFTCILILPIRPTILVAKQAAHADMLSGGRIRLGVAVGGSMLEYEGMGVDFHTRGRRMNEQIEVLRRLWTEDSVTVQSEFHSLRAATVNPQPRRPIPIWIGSGNGSAPMPPDRLLRRAARLADGFTAMSLLPAERASELVTKLRQFAAEAGKDTQAFGVEGDITLTGKDPDQWARETQLWRDAGADRLILRMRDMTPADQLAALETYKKEVGGL